MDFGNNRVWMRVIKAECIYYKFFSTHQYENDVGEIVLVLGYEFKTQCPNRRITSKMIVNEN